MPEFTAAAVRGDHAGACVGSIAGAMTLSGRDVDNM